MKKRKQKEKLSKWNGNIVSDNNNNIQGINEEKTTIKKRKAHEKKWTMNKHFGWK